MPSQAANPILPLHTRFGPYHLEKLIAVGGMAEIYLARAKGLAGFEKQLALKVIHGEFASDDRFTQMLVQEAKLAVGLNHTNIVKTFDLGKIDNVYFITMEYVEGADYFRVLKQLSERDENIPIEAALYVAREVASGLDYAHTRSDDNGQPLGLIHRDISPQNVLLSRHGEVKVADFGVAKVANMSNQTRAGVIKGKLVYMSPEQSWGEQIDQRSDIFSAGIVLYEALTGGSLYVEQNPVKLLQQVREAQIPPPSSIRPDLGSKIDSLVMRALARNAADRYQTAREFESTLAQFLREYAPDYSARDLAETVRSVTDSQRSARHKRVPKSRPDASLEPMDRKDFAVPRHSMVYASNEIMPDSVLDSGVLEDFVAADNFSRAKLILEGEDTTQTYEVGDRFTIGRGGDLRLTDGRVSRRHACITRDDSEYMLEDLNSSNGTFVNRERVSESRRLTSGDVINIGPYQMRFVLEPGFDTAREASAGAAMDDILPQERSAPSTSSGAQAAVAESAVEEPHPAARADMRTRDRRRPRASQRIARQEAYVTLDIGDENIRVAVPDRLPLKHSLGVGDKRFETSVSTIVRREESYWIEPSPDNPSAVLNGQSLVGPKQLSPGDELQVGPLRLRFQSGSA